MVREFVVEHKGDGAERKFVCGPSKSIEPGLVNDVARCRILVVSGLQRPAQQLHRPSDPRVRGQVGLRAARTQARDPHQVVQSQVREARAPDDFERAHREPDGLRRELVTSDPSGLSANGECRAAEGVPERIEVFGRDRVERLRDARQKFGEGASLRVDVGVDPDLLGHWAMLHREPVRPSAEALLRRRHIRRHAS